MKKSLRTIVFGLVGLILGAVVGVVGPVGISLLFALLEGGGPGAGAPTAFALLIILTLPIGAVVGAIYGAFYGNTGKLRLNLVNPIEQFPGLEEYGAEQGVARSLAPSRIKWFIDYKHESDVERSYKEKLAFLEESLNDYCSLVRKRLLAFLVLTLCVAVVFVFNPLIFVPVLLFSAWMLFKEVILMRNRLNEISKSWEINLLDGDLELPWSLHGLDK